MYFHNYDIWRVEEVLLQLSILLEFSALEKNLLCRLWLTTFIAKNEWMNEFIMETVWIKSLKIY